MWVPFLRWNHSFYSIFSIWWLCDILSVKYRKHWLSWHFLQWEQLVLVQFMARNYVARKREMQLNFNNYLKCRLKEHFLMTATKRTMKITAWYLKGFVAISHIFSEQNVRTSFYRVSLALECTIYFVILSTNFYMVLLNKHGGMQSHIV